LAHATPELRRLADPAALLDDVGPVECPIGVTPVKLQVIG
jgi:hypothetical protein